MYLHFVSKIICEEAWRLLTLCLNFTYSDLTANPLRCSCDLLDALPDGKTVNIEGTCEDKIEEKKRQLSSFKTKCGEDGVL